MLHHPLSEITEADIQALVDTKAQESLTLEFKSALDLSRERDKKEAAKDVSAMANAAGGLIVYGVEEGTVGDPPRKCAIGIAALTAPGLREQLDNCLSTSITPRVAVKLREVPVSDGFCLVLRVERSDDAVHMVGAYGDNRYYIRTETAARPMGEVEVARRYDETLRFRSRAEERVKRVLDEEAYSNAYRLTLIGVPWLSQDDAIDPATFQPRALVESGIRDVRGLEALVSKMRASAAGCETYDRSRSFASQTDGLRVRRDGAIVWATSSIANSADGERIRFNDVFREIYDFCAVARFVWRRHEIRGQATIAFLLNLPGSSVEAFVTEPLHPQLHLSVEKPIELRHQVRAEDDFGLTVERAFMDRLWQHMGRSRCDYFFEPNGAPTYRGRELLGVPE